MGAWQQYNVTTTYRFGWMPPMLEDPDESLLLMFSYCPELLAAVTAHLDEHGLDLYLTVVEAFFDGWVTPPVGDWDRDYQEIVDLLEQHQPDIVRFKDQVELHALDAGIVPRGMPTVR